MKITELRIGNWISDIHSERGAWEVKQLTITKCYYGDYRSFYRNLEPIPLTEEWLIKFGFVNEDDYMELDINESISIIWVGYLSIMVNGCINFLNSNSLYVHQLQNLYFALTNEELTITQ